MLIFARGRRVVVLSALALAAGCGGSPPDAVESGTEVTIEMPDGSLVTGRVVEPADEEVLSDFGSTPDQEAGTGSESAQSTRSLGEQPSTALTSATGTSPAGSPALPGASDLTAGGPDSTQAAPDSTHQASDSTAGAPDSIEGRTVDSSTNAKGRDLLRRQQLTGVVTRESATFAWIRRVHRRNAARKTRLDGGLLKRCHFGL